MRREGCSVIEWAWIGRVRRSRLVDDPPGVLLPDRRRLRCAGIGERPGRRRDADWPDGAAEAAAPATRRGRSRAIRWLPGRRTSPRGPSG